MHRLLFILLIAQTSRAQCGNYNVQDVAGPNCGITGDAGAIGYGLSESGWVCGFFSNCASYERPFYWPAGGVRTEITFAVPYGPQGRAIARAVADSPFVVGVVHAVGVSTAFRFHLGQAELLASLPGDYLSDALSANSSGNVVGTSTGNVLRACAWFNGQPTDLNLPVGPSSAAACINDANQICGWMGSDDPSEGTTPFIWQNGATTVLSVPRAAFNGSAQSTALNNRGDACGSYFTFDRANRTYVRQGCAWIGGHLVELGTLPGLQGALPLDINDAREIVGYATDAFNNAIKPFLWRNGVMYDLNDLVPPGTPVLYIAHAINDKGQIAGEAVNGISLAFLLTPAPPAHAGDTDCDSQVNINDLLNVINRWNPQGPVGGEPADLNRDNKIDHLDLLETIFHWGQ